MTNHWVDIKNAKLVLICGANPAENHPGGFQWALEAREKNGAKIVVIDPRRTRVATMADNFMRIRPGTNSAFMMGLINYAIDKGYVNYDYLRATVTRPFIADGDGATGTNVPNWPKWTDAPFKLRKEDNPSSPNFGKYVDYERANVTIGSKTITNLPVIETDWEDTVNNPDTVWAEIKRTAAHYTSARVADICDIPGGAAEFDLIAEVVTHPSNRPGTILYAMGGTQHSHASQDLRSYCLLQLVLGNMGQAGGGVNALRGIHNVQGSTDQGLLYASVPGYSATPGIGQRYGAYMNSLFGNQKTAASPYWTGLQQAGFRNMMHWYFRQAADPVAAQSADPTYGEAEHNKNYDCMPKGGDYIHMEMFKYMAASTPEGQRVKSMFIFGQNPAVTEPNLGVVKTGLHDLDMLVVSDIFESETAGCDRKSDGVTYLLPAAAFVEEAGSVTNSGRVLQWREQAIQPKGGSKSDLEILLRLAKALDSKNAFSHIPMPIQPNGAAYTDRYEGLYASQYGWTPGATFDNTAVAEKIFMQMCNDNQGAPSGQSVTVNGVTHTDDQGYGALWIYIGAWSLNTGTAPFAASRLGTGMTFSDWADGGGVPNRAKSRNTKDPTGLGLTPCWGYAWLVNRRVFYNNGLAGDVGDFFVAPDKVARLWVHDASHSPAIANYSSTYRAYSKLIGGSIPVHHEPVESPRPDLQTTYGSIASTKYAAQEVGSVEQYPLILTTIRVTEHFQGGPLTRNLPWLCELVPEPFIEINGMDASEKDIASGDKVFIDTARGSAGPFKAVVGTGGEQRVSKGYVAIPWHWGNKGISQGPSANEITIDALDPDSYIPEFKSCLCKIRKA